MSKKNNTINPEVVKEIMENNNLPESVKAPMLAKANAQLEAQAAKEAKKTEAKTPKTQKEPKTEKTEKTVDITTLLEAMPDTFTPAIPAQRRWQDCTPSPPQPLR